MRMLALLTPALLVLVAPASAAPPRCAQTRPPVLDIRQHDRRQGVQIRSRVVRCDGLVLVSRRLRRLAGRPGRRGTLIADADVRGRRLAWIEESVGHRRSVARLIVADARNGRVLERRVVLRSRASVQQPELAVALVADGIAWLARGAVHVQFPGRRSRVVARAHFLHGPMVVEDNRTLRFGRFDSQQWVDVLPARARLPTARGLEGRRGHQRVHSHHAHLPRSDRRGLRRLV
ncbi:MAG: hypothetical protein LC777_09835 [Actinobacteria bacterium]|nr:hypothetical protein [Actinomycetota bacterium]